MRIRSVRAKLTLWYTGLLALTFLFLGGAVYVLLFYTLYDETDTALRSVAETLGRRAASEARVSIPPELEDLFHRFFGLSRGGTYYEWLDPSSEKEQGSIRMRKFPLTIEARNNAIRGIATFETLTDSDEIYPVRILTWPAFESGHARAIIRVGISRENLYKTLHRFLIIMLSLLPLALILAGWGGWILARRALLPVDKMTKAARTIEAGQLHARLDLTGAQDELDRLAETLNEMFARLDAAFTEMRQFTADASHELQTPITIIRGEIEVALRSNRSVEEYREVLISALEEIERISRLVEALLLLARADAGVLRMDRKEVNLAYIAEEAISQAALLANSRSVRFVVTQIELVETKGDPDHLRRLLLNLLENALKYTPVGGTVSLSLSKQDNWAVIKVQDTGPGIPLEEQSKIFQRFYRSPEARAAGLGGSGLGLSIVRSIVEAHGGKVELESKPGEGSTFIVYLPEG